MNHKFWCLKRAFIWLWHKKPLTTLTISENYQTIQVIVTSSQPVFFFRLRTIFYPPDVQPELKYSIFRHQQRDNGRGKNKWDLFIKNHLQIHWSSQNQHGHVLTLRAQFTKSSSLVMTYSPLLLATAAGLAAATAVLFSLTGTTLQQKDEGENLHHVLWGLPSVCCSTANSPGGGILTLSTAVQTLLLKGKHRNGSVEQKWDQREKLSK